MSWKPITLSGITFLSHQKKPALIDFKRGLNVICGATDSGKSFVLETIDFMLASSYPVELKDFKERVGYDTVRLIVETIDEHLTLQRPAVMNSNYLVFFGKYFTESIKAPDLKLIPNPRPGQNSVSNFLLSMIGLSEKVVLTNKGGETKALGFRHLIPFILIDEEKIIKSKSNVVSDNFLFSTRDYSIFKLLLTGDDDSALQAVELPTEINTTLTKNNNFEKSTFIDELISEIDIALHKDGRTLIQLEERLIQINGISVLQTTYLSENQRLLNSLDEERHSILKDQKEISGRIDELNSLFARFDLLKKHYQVDLERLSAIEESGSLFAHLAKSQCPLCGASIAEQHLNEQCDGNVEEVIIAARSEALKVTRLLRELEQTIGDLNVERNDLIQWKEDTVENTKNIDSRIKELMAPLEEIQVNFDELLEESVKIRGLIDKFKSRDSLINKRNLLLESLEEIKESTPDETEPLTPLSISAEFSKSVLDKYAEKVESLLKSWHFPDCERVYFDTETKDIVINGKPRGNRGKGLRAIAQAAMTIGLMEYCRDNDLSHPGFVVLDSPLLGYYKPDGEDDSLKGTDLKERFYEHLSSNYNDCQIIIIENEDPPIGLDQINVTHFTKNPHEGRYGFFPYVE